MSRLWAGCPLSAEFVLGVVLVQQFDMCEGKVTTLAFTFALPLAVHVYFGHLHHVAHLGNKRESFCNQRNDKMYYYHHFHH